MSPLDPIVIVAAQRTPTGAFQGALSSLSTTDLGAVAIKAALTQANLKPTEIDDVLMGCVLPAGLGQAPARQAALKAGLSQQTGCLTINKVCGSGLKSIMLAYDPIAAGSAQIIIAGGMESMSNAPYLSLEARNGLRMGHHSLIDHMMFDGLQDSFSNGSAMGLLAEEVATKYGLTRERQDEFAAGSAAKALKAQSAGWFTEEITPVDIQTRKETFTVTEDEPPKKVRQDKFATLRPAFKKGGTLTAANSSSISDGAGAVVLMRQSEAERRGLEPLARIVAHAGYSREPQWFTLAPAGAVQKTLEKAGWRIEDVDLFEINEAFAVVTLACMEDCKIPAEKVNIHGGACALGHPIGASGTRILNTLLYALKTHNKKRGIATLCIGGGEAVALAIERL
jgi:acetyl-CoA C-acetyltransferase